MVRSRIMPAAIRAAELSFKQRFDCPPDYCDPQLSNKRSVNCIIMDSNRERLEPDMQISRIRLSDKTSRLHPRHVVPKPAQAYEPEVPVKVLEWIRPALASPDLVLEAQPPAQPHSGVVVDRPVRLGGGAYFEVVRPSAQRAVQLLHQLCGLLPSPRSVFMSVAFAPALVGMLVWVAYGTQGPKHITRPVQLETNSPRLSQRRGSLS